MIERIKATSVTNLTDARYFAAFENSYIGFNFDALQPNSITLNTAKMISGWLFEPNLVAEFGAHQNIEEIDFIFTQLSFCAIEIPISHLDFRKLIIKYDCFLRVSGENLANIPVFNKQRHLRLIVDVKHFIQKKEFASIQMGNYFLEITPPLENILSIIKTINPKNLSIKCDMEIRPGWGMVDEYDSLLSTLESKA